MTIIKRKTVFVPYEAWHSLSTSRRLQWLAILITLLAIIGGLMCWHYQKEEKVRVAQQHLAESLFHFPLDGNVVALGIETERLPASLRESFSADIEKKLSGTFPTTAFAGNILLPDFYTQGYFAKAFAGDTAFLGEMGFFKGAKKLLLLKPEVSFTDSSLGNGMKSCAVDLTFRSYDSPESSGHPNVIHLVGNGFSEEASMRDALDKLPQDQQGEFISALKN